MENDDKEFFEKLANYTEEIEKNDAGPEKDYEFQYAKASPNTASKLNISTNYVYNEDDFDETEGELAIDVYQTPDELVIESPIAGINPDDIDINISNDAVTIRGKRRRSNEIKEKDYLYQECFWGKFSRHIVLPQEIDPEKSIATFKNGVLKLVLPKLYRKKSKKLKVISE